MWGYTSFFFLLFLSPRRILLFCLSFYGIWFFFWDSWFSWYFIFYFLDPLLAFLFFLQWSFFSPPVLSVFIILLFWQCKNFFISFIIPVLLKTPSFNIQLVVVPASVLREGKWSPYLCFSMPGSNTVVNVEMKTDKSHGGKYENFMGKWFIASCLQVVRDCKSLECKVPSARSSC